MNFANFKALCAKSNCFRHFYKHKIFPFSYSILKLSVKQSRSYITFVAGFRSCAVSSKVFQRAVYFNTHLQRFKTSKGKSKTSSGKDENDVSDDEEEEEDESFSDIEPDYDSPQNYKHTLVHSLRADVIIAKGLLMSTREAERKFYESKFLCGGRTLLKKAKKLNVGEHIDVIHEEENGKLLVQRVKVIKILNRLTRKGKPVVAVRVWKKPFEIDKQGS